MNVSRKARFVTSEDKERVRLQISVDLHLFNLITWSRTE